MSYHLERIEAAEPYYLYIYRIDGTDNEIKVIILYDYIANILEIVNVEQATIQINYEPLSIDSGPPSIDLIGLPSPTFEHG